jgi:hypothetical protein
VAKDMVCQLCQGEGEPEIAVMLVSDLTGTGQLPLPVGLNCMEAFLLSILESIAQPEGIPAPPPSELEEDELETPTETSLAAQEPAVASAGPTEAPEASEDPPVQTGPSGPSQRESSGPVTTNGTRKRAARTAAAAKTTD